MSNTGDVPVSTKVVDVVDRITGTAVYTTGIGDAPGSLAITALSSDKVAPRVLTASGFAAQPLDLAAGALTVPSLDAPPVTVTVTSDAGGTVKLPVEIIGAEDVPIPAVAKAGPDQIVTPGQLVTLDGSASTGTGLTYAWTSPAGIALSDPIAVNPTFTAPDLPGTYPITLTVTGLAGTSTATVTITVANAPDAPVIGTVTAADTTATVTWTAPADGGSPITGYTVRVVDAAGLQIGDLLPGSCGRNQPGRDRADQRYSGQVPGPGQQRGGNGCLLRPVRRSDPDRAAQRACDRDRDRRRHHGNGHVDRAGRRRLADHRVRRPGGRRGHGRSGRCSAARSCRRNQPGGDRAGQRHRAQVPGPGQQCAGYGCLLGPVRRRDTRRGA